MTGACRGKPFAGKKASLTGSQNASALPCTAQAVGNAWQHVEKARQHLYLHATQTSRGCYQHPLRRWEVTNPPVKGRIRAVSQRPESGTPLQTSASAQESKERSPMPEPACLLGSCRPVASLPQHPGPFCLGKAGRRPCAHPAGLDTAAMLPALFQSVYPPRYRSGRCRPYHPDIECCCQGCFENGWPECGSTAGP